MNVKSIAALAAALIAGSAFAASPADAKCGAGTCGKKETTEDKKDAACSKKDTACSKKESSCSKK